MKKKTTEKTPAELTYSEIEYVYTCWKQAYKAAYPEFTDYLKVAINGKEIYGRVYQ